MATAAPAKSPARIDYGIDAPGVIRNLAVAGLACLALSYFVHEVRLGPVILEVKQMFINTGCGCLAGAVLMYVYARFGKFRHRDRMLQMIAWRGDERVLDVGTGRGLLAIGAAKRVPLGQVTGIDIWSTKDLSGNAIGATRANIVAEGVAGNCAVENGDVRKLSFPDGSFDVIVNNLCLHNIPSAEERAVGCREIYRVLKPGGVAMISDFWRMREYRKTFSETDAEVKWMGLDFLRTFPALRIMMVKKPARA